MSQLNILAERNLAALAKRCRKQAKISRAQAAREMRVSQTSIFHAEESPRQALVKLRIRMIEKYSHSKVKGPVFVLTKK
jgi:DNA-binding XRE family transcriptional regulator